MLSWMNVKEEGGVDRVGPGGMGGGARVLKEGRGREREREGICRKGEGFWEDGWMKRG